MGSHKCITNVGGHTVRAFADGDMISVVFNTDKRSVHVGTDGRGRHIKSADRSGVITVRLSSYSPSNAAFQLLDETDIPFGIGVIDKSSNGDSFFAGSCMLVKVPDMVKGATETVLEYGFQFTHGTVVRAGADSEGLLAELAGIVS